MRQVPENSLPQQDLLQPERLRGTVPFSLRKACAKIGTVPDRWYIFSRNLTGFSAEKWALESGA